MPIQTIHVGKHENILSVEFGTGDVMFSRTILSTGFTLIFTENKTPAKIGEISNEFAGKNTDDMPIKLALSFKKPEAITALIHSLVELQKDMFAGELTNVIAPTE